MKTFRTRSLLWEKVCSGRREERDNRSNMASQRAREDPSPPPTCRGEPVPPGPEWEAGIETEEESHGPRTQPRRVTESALSETSPHSPKSSSCASHPATTFRHPPSCDKPCQFFCLSAKPSGDQNNVCPVPLASPEPSTAPGTLQRLRLPVPQFPYCERHSISAPTR